MYSNCTEGIVNVHARGQSVLEYSRSNRMVSLAGAEGKWCKWRPMSQWRDKD